MSSADLTAFLNALEAVKGDYVCVVCSELCKNPVTLSKCFHLICGEHFDGLESCPKCNTSCKGSTIYVDDRLCSCIDSANELDQIFERFKPKSVPKPDTNSRATKRRGKTATITKPDNKSQKTKALSDKTNKIVSNELNDSIFSASSSTKHNKTFEKRNNKGETMLHISCRLGKVDKIMELLKQGANPNTKDNAGWTPLHEVVQNGKLDLVKLLLQYKSLINVPGQSNETPLHEAVRYNHIDIAVELVKTGADLNARNSKGETPLQLASSEMKDKLLAASDEIVQTQTANVTLISNMHSELDFEDIRLYCVSHFRTIHNKLKSLARHHNNVHIETRFTNKTTHLIVDTEDDDDKFCASSLDVLQGIACGVWVLTTQWVTQATDEKLPPFEKYEVLGIGSKEYNGPKSSRYNKYKQLPGLLDGCHFYLHNFNTKYEITKQIVVTKANLTKLITDAGGKVLRRVPNPESIPDSEKLVPYHAKKDGKLANCSHYIIFKDVYEPMYNMTHLKALPIGWLIECLEKYELCEPILYNYV